MVHVMSSISREDALILEHPKSAVDLHGVKQGFALRIYFVHLGVINRAIALEFLEGLRISLFAVLH